MSGLSGLGKNHVVFHLLKFDPEATRLGAHVQQAPLWPHQKAGKDGLKSRKMPHRGKGFFQQIR